MFLCLVSTLKPSILYRVGEIESSSFVSWRQIISAFISRHRLLSCSILFPCVIELTLNDTMFRSLLLIGDRSPSTMFTVLTSKSESEDMESEDTVLKLSNSLGANPYFEGPTVGASLIFCSKNHGIES